MTRHFFRHDTNGFPEYTFAAIDTFFPHNLSDHCLIAVFRSSGVDVRRVQPATRVTHQVPRTGRRRQREHNQLRRRGRRRRRHDRV